MAIGKKPKLNPRKRYLQIALNSTLNDAFYIINSLPRSDRIIIEAGTPLIKRYGEDGIRKIKSWYQQHLLGVTTAMDTERPQVNLSAFGLLGAIVKQIQQKQQEQMAKQREILSKFNIGNKKPEENIVMEPYVVADLKMMDRGETEVNIASRAGADAAVALGHAPIESLDAFIQHCEDQGLDSMVDMMNVEYPLAVLRQLRKVPTVVILHRGVDEERFNKEKQIPLHEIRRIKGNYDMMIAIAGGDTIQEVQRSLFNDADIVVVWKSFYQSSKDTASLAQEFLKRIK
jgi:3-keto-L-gulonate-6-phosphate decarboxylase